MYVRGRVMVKSFNEKHMRVSVWVSVRIKVG